MFVYLLSFTVSWAGIDYSVKTLTLDNMQVAMQLWDTAGQERRVSVFSATRNSENLF